jgi:DNA-binding HxlR family transcriptional regulator
MAKAMELLGERWTLLVVRELLLGSSHFNDLRRGVPKMSPGLLSKRLQTLIRVGVVERCEVDGRTSYRLTPSGQQLKEVVQALNDWGVRWTGELRDEDLDLRMLTWEIRRTIPIDAWPRKRTVLAFRMAGVAPKASSWWLMVAEGQADICDADPGYDISATITTSLRALTEIWRGHISWSRALLDGSISVDALADVRRDLPSWLGQKSAASVARPA